MERRTKVMNPAIDHVVSEAGRTIARHRMLEGASRCVVAFSAGPDSVCLLDVLMRLYGSKVEFHLVYVNHGLRPQRILRREEELVERYARKYGLNRDIVKIKVGKSRLGVESRARELRYQALARVMKKSGSQRVALGHNLDDLAETFFMNMIRGSGAKGLQSIPAVRHPYVRPLINIKKAEILRYLKAAKLKFCVDATNADLKRRRNLIRRSVMPRLLEINPRLYETVRKSIEFIKMDDEHIEAQAERVYPMVVRRKGQNLSLDMPKLIRYNKALSYRIVRKAFFKLAGSLDGFESKHFELFFGLMSKENGKSINLPRDLFAQRDFDRILLGKKAEKGFFCRNLKLNGELTAWDSMKIRTRLVREFDLSERRSGVEVFDRAKISPPLFVRSLKPGDRILTRIGRKRIKKYYNEYKIPHHERSRLLVLEDRKGILWLLGYGRAHRAWVGPGTKAILKVEIEKTD